ncbi:MAG: hypothetical protein BGP11_20645 [Rhodobacterales bacterium 65-51]|uniref:dihydroorotate dehydrogenase n=1 Tax=uncultured Gemmobacter sp. TaxID=1095917 RepID=UPI00096329AB|nr:dihydroorotate dehydrogenase [uncultured Gemmobacter sp.]OJY33310.1 MAG: hypothetical protein BGP11_20645 [Rhodobacterales bacterium 65-51]
MSVRLRDDVGLTAEALDSLFEEARAAAPPEASVLMARVLADSYAAQDALPQHTAPPRPAARRGRLAGLFSPANNRAAAGLVAATLAGVWIGFVQPAPVADVSQALEPAAVDVVELIPDLEIWLAEG